MLRKGKLIALVLIFLIAGCGGPMTVDVAASSGGSALDSNVSVSPYPGGKAPDFSLRELSSGKIVSLSQLEREHKPIFINVFASWCGPCNMEAPDIYAAEKTYGSRIQFIGLNMTSQETGVSDVRAFTAKYHLTFPILLDPDALFLDKYSINAFPTSLFIDGSGKIISRQDAMLTKAQLGAYLHKLVSSEAQS